MLRNQTYSLEKNKLQRKLLTAMEYAKNTCILGSDNKIKDIKKTRGWNLCQNDRYDMPGKYLKISDGKFSHEEDGEANAQFNPKTRKLFYDIKQWYYHPIGKKPMLFVEPIHAKQNPLQDDTFKLPMHHILFLARTLLLINKRQGNCNDLALLISKYLWEHPADIKRIEIISMATFDHVLVVVNRSGDLDKPKTWGDAWVIDAWYGDHGLIFPANQFEEKIKIIKKFAQKQARLCAAIGVNALSSVDHGNDIDRCAWEIKPATDKYPTYTPGKRIEDYYIVRNCHPALNNPYDNIRPVIQKNMDDHKIKFNACLKELNNFFQKRGIEDGLSCENDDRPSKNRL